MTRTSFILALPAAMLVAVLNASGRGVLVVDGFMTMAVNKDMGTIRDTSQKLFSKSSDSTAECGDIGRRQALQKTGGSVFLSLFGITSATLILQTLPANAAESLASTREKIVTARDQLKTVPELIKKEQWDSVRAVLVKPPLSDCWNKRQPLLQSYAELLGDTEDGDELAALEAKEEAASHFRYLDMAAYNNVFNPIKAEGENGATKELIRSYYEDPKNEYAASLKALDDLLELSK